jgi:mono/diheme cytochrome c family protein
MAFAVLLAACGASSGTNPEAGKGPALDAVNEGKSLQNPVAVTAESLASGKKFYDRLCANCHGDKADGNSEFAGTLAEGEVKPPDLTDDKWDHGDSDGEIFVSIRDGVGSDRAMKGLNGRPGVGPHEMWNMVNYVRSLRKN